MLTQCRDRDKPPLAPVRALASVSFQGKVEEEMVDGMNHTLPPSRPTPSRRAGKPLP
ncbi:MAG: hypothetical protein ACR2G2_09520 [Pseudonocardia sp.]